MTMRTYEYRGFTLHVSVESRFTLQLTKRPVAHSGYIAAVSIFKEDYAVANFSPLRLNEAGGHPFITEVDALMGGYSAARQIVDDLLEQKTC